MKADPITRFVTKLEDICVWISAALIVFTMIYVTLDVVARLVFKTSIGGGTEALICLVTVWVAYMAVPYTTRTGGQVAMSFVSDRLRGKAKLIDNIFISVVSCVFFIILTYATYQMFMGDFANNTIVDATFPFKLRLWWGRLAMPIGCIIQVLACLCTIVKNVRMLASGVTEESLKAAEEETTGEGSAE